MVRVEYVTQADKPFWFTLDKHLEEREFELKIRDKRGYVIFSGDKPIGVMRYNLFWDNMPFLTLIYFEESHRGKGFGRHAMSVWEREMRELGYMMVMTSTQVDEDSQHFYRKLGYVDRGGVFFDHTPFEQPQEMIMIKVLE